MGDKLIEVILRGEDGLLEQILAQAEASGLFRFASRVPEGWRAAIRGISGSLVQAYRNSTEPLALRVEELGTDDGVTAFAVVEARKYRLAGMPLGIFLAFGKIFRRAYEDLVRSAGLPPGDTERHLAYLGRFFDRNEIACSVSWTAEGSFEQAQELLQKHEDLSNFHELVATAKEEWERAIDCVEDMLLLVDRRGHLRRCNLSFRTFAGKEYGAILDHPCGQVLRDAGLPADITYGRPVEHFHERTGKWLVASRYPCRIHPPEDGDGNGDVIVIHDATGIQRAARQLERRYERVSRALARIQRSQVLLLRREKRDTVVRLATGLSGDLHGPASVLANNLKTLATYFERLKEILADQSACIAAGAPPRLVDAIRTKRDRLKVDYILKDTDELVGESLEGAERLDTIVADLRGFSRTEPAGFQDADLNDCVRDAVRGVRSEPDRQAALTCELGAVPRTRCAPREMSRAISRLLLHATHASEPRGTVTVRSWPEDGFVCVSVTDSGPPIPEERLERIFDPFYAARETGDVEKLGLSIAHDIVGKHQGEIRVSSAPGRGTTFTVRIPVVADS
jgi:two-component system, NtrC family, sensor kinase